MDLEIGGGGGVGLVTLLTIVFITLKLTNYITWSWWWVLSPLWISFVVSIVVFFLIVLIAWISQG